jgi:outer membrane protein OmpA-like peptidoglycan-associated protein
VRLYFVSLIEKERHLRLSGILDGSTDDPDERVRATVARINKEDPPYWRAPPHSQTNMVTSESRRTVSRPSATKVLPSMDAPSESVLHRVPAAMMFNNDKSEIRPEAYPDLDRIGQLLRIRSDTTARIEMHADKLAKSSSSYCQRLSQKRAEAVKTYFVNKFTVAPSRLNAVGCGFDSPSEPNDLIKGNPANRRVDIDINNNQGMNEIRNP